MQNLNEECLLELQENIKEKIGRGLMSSLFSQM